MSDSKPQLVMLITVEDDTGKGDHVDYLHVKVDLLTRQGDEIRGMSASDYTANQPPEIYDDLQITAQLDPGTAREDGRLYGWNIHFTPFRLGLGRAREIVKVLSMLDKKLASMAETFGTAPDFASYLLRIGAALHVAHFARIGKRGHLWSNSEIIWLTSDEARRYIEQAEATYIAAHRPVDAQVIPLREAR